MDRNITKDPAYDAADPHDFPAMLEVERYGKRSTAFDKIISATHDHFWDPLDKKYTVGFNATGSILRSDFGVKTYLPLIGDEVDLIISAGFERQDQPAADAGGAK